eukprot:6784097-Pyramimonas_sp.AAC.1
MAIMCLLFPALRSLPCSGPDSRQVAHFGAQRVLSFVLLLTLPIWAFRCFSRLLPILSFSTFGLAGAQVPLRGERSGDPGLIRLRIPRQWPEIGRPSAPMHVP